TDPSGQVILETTVIFVGVQAAVLGGTYLMAKVVQAITSYLNPPNCDQSQQINEAFKLAALAAFAPAVPLAAIESCAIAVPAITTTVIQNPQIVQNIGDFVDGAIMPGPHPPSLSVYSGQIVGQIVQEAYEAKKRK